MTDRAASAPPRKPALLRGGMVVCWIYAGVLALLLWLFPSDQIRGGMGIGSVFIKGEPGRPAPTAHFAGEILTASRFFIIPLLVVSIVTAYGLTKDRHWSRWVMMALLVLGVVLIPPRLATPLDYAVSLALAIFGWWYLYRKPNVVAYYEAIHGKCFGATEVRPL